MAAYIGILSNRGRILPDDDAALDYVMNKLGLAPENTWNEVNKPLLLAYFDLPAFLSGNWLRYGSLEEYEAERARETIPGGSGGEQADGSGSVCPAG